MTSEHYFLQPVSQTFHGRDVFAACAGWLSKGVEISKFGDEITDYIRFAAPKPKPVDGKSFKAVVLKTDKFGNLITNITPKDVPQLFEDTPPAFKRGARQSRRVLARGYRPVTALAAGPISPVVPPRRGRPGAWPNPAVSGPRCS